MLTLKYLTNLTIFYTTCIKPNNKKLYQLLHPTFDFQELAELTLKRCSVSQRCKCEDWSFFLSLVHYLFDLQTLQQYKYNLNQVEKFLKGH